MKDNKRFSIITSIEPPTKLINTLRKKHQENTFEISETDDDNIPKTNYNSVDRRDHLPVGACQGLVNLEPDIDTVYRLVDGREICSLERPPIAIREGMWSPFNSQNTLFASKLFPILCLSTTGSFRFTDILRSYVAQPILWVHQHLLGFFGATVYMIIEGFIIQGQSVTNQICLIYKNLVTHKAINEEELQSLESWLRVVSNK